MTSLLSAAAEASAAGVMILADVTEVVRLVLFLAPAATVVTTSAAVIGALV